MRIYKWFSLVFVALFLLGWNLPPRAVSAPSASSDSPSTLPTRLIVATHNRGLFGWQGKPEGAELLNQIETETAIGARALEGAAEVEIIQFDHVLTETELTQALASLRAVDGVTSVEQDPVASIDQTPNDPYLAVMDHLTSPSVGINVESAWDLTTGAADIRVAVIDTGITDHPDLAGRWTGGYDMISTSDVAVDGDGRDADPHDPGDNNPSLSKTNSWHGSHVAGTIGAVANNATGVVGINWQSPIIPVRVLGKGGGYASDIADGIRWAAGLPVSGVPTNTLPARVLNLSLGGSGSCPSYMQTAIDAAVAAGAVVVVAAGNNTADASAYFPANCANVITVAATDESGDLAYYSNYGSTIEISAPGSSVASTVYSGTYTLGTPAYAYKQGTSMATPHVAGVISLMLSVNPALTPAQITSLLPAISRAFVSGSSCSTTQCGAGALDALLAVQAAQDAIPPTPTFTDVPTQVNTIAPTLTNTPIPSLTPSPTADAPVVRSIVPSHISGDDDATLTIYGDSFPEDPTVKVAARLFTPSQIEPDHLTVAIPADVLPTGSHTIYVCGSAGVACTDTSAKIQVDAANIYLPAVVRP